MEPFRIADRYRVERLLAEGGMGRVYLAYDENLDDRTVAVKVLRPDKPLSDAERERFHREAKAVGKLSHRAIVKIHDFQRWQDRDAIVMEYVEGKTLRDVISEGGPLEISSAVELAQDVAGGLAEAHGQGIVHRDLKPENVMMTAEGHAKVLDFGVAKVLGATSLTSTEKIIGTWRYMSPEQLAGETIDATTDLFALGALLYEMLTGKPAFPGETRAEIAAQIHYSRPKPVSARRAEVPVELSDLVERLLEKDPSRRPASADEVLRALRRPFEVRSQIPVKPDERTLTSPEHAARRRRKWMFLATAIVAVAATLAGIGVVQLVGPFARDGVGQRREGDLAANEGRTQDGRGLEGPGVAVLTFENATADPDPDLDWLRTALPEILRTALAAGDEVHIVHGQRIADAERDVTLGSLRTISSSDRSRLRSYLDANVLVGGSYEVVGDGETRTLRVVVYFDDDGDVRTLAPVSGVIAPLAPLARKAAAPVRDMLELAVLTPEQGAEVTASFPGNAEAARLCAEALESLRRQDGRTASDLLDRAIKEEPDHPLPHALLAAAWLVQEDFDKARPAALEAQRLGNKLPVDQRRRIEVYLHKAEKDWDAAVKVWRASFEASPEDLDLALALAETQILAGQPEEALATLRRPRGASSNVHVALTRTWAWHVEGNLEKTVAAARQACKLAPNKGHIYAQALREEAAALHGLGKIDDAIAALDDALRVLRGLNDPRSLASACELKAGMVHEQGDLDGARRLYERALSSFRESQDTRGEGRALVSLATVCYQQGRHEDARTWFEAALGILDRFGAQQESAVARVNFGAFLQEQGDLDAARARYTEALTRFQDLGNEPWTAAVLTNLAEIHYVGGDLTNARRFHQEALAINRRLGEISGAAYDTYRFGRVFTAQGDWTVARQRYEEALKDQEKLGERAAAAETRLALAELTLLEGDAASAEAQAREAEEVLRVDGLADKAALTHAVLARSALALHSTEAARAWAARLHARATKSTDAAVRFVDGMLAAKLQAADGDVDDALEALAALAAKATDEGRRLDAFEARLTTGEIELTAGRGEAARGRLARLRGEAEDAGALGIVRRVDGLADAVK